MSGIRTPALVRARAALTAAPAQPVRRSGYRRALWPLLGACLALGTLSLLLPSTPTYDPWAWLIWGREIVGGRLDTEGGPSWKPLAVLLTTLLAPLGDLAPLAWVALARAGALLALAMAYRIAARIAGPLAGVSAAVVLLLTDNWIRNAAIGTSEGLLVALVLWAVERHLDDRRGHAFALGVAAALLRPEVWPFLGLYVLWLWVREPRLRARLVVGVALIPLLWFGPELIISGDPLRASTRANEPNQDSPAFAAFPALEVAQRAGMLLLPPFLVLFVGGAAWAARAWLVHRREGTTLALAAGALAWTGLVAAMTEAGYSGNQRYLVVWAGLASVVAGVAVARVVRDTEHWRVPRARALAWATLAAMTVPVLPWMVAKQVEDARTVAYEASLYRELDSAVALAGGPAAVRRCGEAFTGPFQVPWIAWRLGLHTGAVSYEPRAPGVVFRTRPEPGTRTAPTIPPPAAPFRAAGTAGPWEVYLACPPAETG